MKASVKKVVVLGGGTAGWMSAALLKKVFGKQIDLSLIESDTIGTVGVGEATIPPIQLVNSVLGLNEAEFLRETQATIKLAIKFENWHQQDKSYFHTFGAPGKSMAFCQFHQFWRRAKSLGLQDSIWQYDLNYLCAVEGKFAPIKSKDSAFELPYAYHFDASLYAKFLRQFSEKLGVQRYEGKVVEVKQHSETGFVTSLRLEDGHQLDGDLFIDCSGFRGLLIQQSLNTGYEDWSHWLPCDSALAVPSQRHQKTLPYTRSIAHKAGWQWRIPLQHRNGNGMVYASNYWDDSDAQDTLLRNLETEPLADPQVIRFKTGRRRQQWNRNVVAVGLSSGFLEPLESTSIHLIQSAIVRLIHLFPHTGVQVANVAEYNRQSKVEFEQIRDFLILHYHQNKRIDSDFWRDVREMDIPDSLKHKMALFSANGSLFRQQDDLFLDSSWLQVMMGQGIEPIDYHPLANGPDDDQLLKMMANMHQAKRKPLTDLPSHDEFLRQCCKQ